MQETHNICYIPWCLYSLDQFLLEELAEIHSVEEEVSGELHIQYCSRNVFFVSIFEGLTKGFEMTLSTSSLLARGLQSPLPYSSLRRTERKETIRDQLNAIQMSESVDCPLPSSKMIEVCVDCPLP